MKSGLACLTCGVGVLQNSNTNGKGAAVGLLLREVRGVFETHGSVAWCGLGSVKV